jgi:hypothetical protein
MPRRVLVFAMLDWLGAARLPGGLTRAGFEVGVLCPKSSLISLTRFVSRRAEVEGRVHVRELGLAIHKFVTKWGAQAIIATDDQSVRYLHDFAAQCYGKTLEPQFSEPGFLTVLDRSLPAGKHLQSLSTKSAMHSIAEAAGVSVPPVVLTKGVDDALAHAAKWGYPIVLKPDRGSAGFGVTICRDERGLRSTYQELASHPRRPADNAILAQVYITGQQVDYPFVANSGKVFAGLTKYKIHAHPAPLGPSSVIEIIDEPSIDQSAGKVVAALRYNSFGSVQFVIEAATKQPYFLELNPRPVPIIHAPQELVGIDWCQAWHAAIAGETPPIFNGPIVGRKVALFPQEWYRDRNSRFLHYEAVHDVPWDDPALLQGYLNHRP